MPTEFSNETRAGIASEVARRLRLDGQRAQSDARAIAFISICRLNSAVHDGLENTVAVLGGEEISGPHPMRERITRMIESLALKDMQTHEGEPAYALYFKDVAGRTISRYPFIVTSDGDAKPTEADAHTAPQIERITTMLEQISTAQEALVERLRAGLDKCDALIVVVTQQQKEHADKADALRVENEVQRAEVERLRELVRAALGAAIKESLECPTCQGGRCTKCEHVQQWVDDARAAIEPVAATKSSDGP